MFHVHFAVPEENDFHESYEQYEWAMEAAEEIIEEHMARHIHPRNPDYDRRVQEMLRDLGRFTFAPAPIPDAHVGSKFTNVRMITPLTIRRKPCDGKKRSAMRHLLSPGARG